MTADPFRVLVAGASGRTGCEVLRQLSSAGYAVRALSSTRQHRFKLLDYGADEVLAGDLFDREECAAAAEDCDAVVCVVGERGLSRLRGPFVDGKGVCNLVDAAVDEDVSHFVLCSALGVGDSRSGFGLVGRLLLRRVLAAKADAEEHLRNSGIGYTIVRPGQLTDGDPTRDLVVGEGGDTVTGSIPRRDLAWLLAAALSTPAARNRTFEVVSHDGLDGPAQGVVDVAFTGPESWTPLDKARSTSS